MADSSINVKGLSDLQKLLDDLPVKMEQNIMRGALRAGAKLVKAQAESNAPNVTGNLRFSLRIGTKKEGSNVVANIKSLDFIARFVEYGTRGHWLSVPDEEKPINQNLSSKRGRLVLASMTTINRNYMKIGNTFIGGALYHPGSRPRPFLRPALDAQAQNAVRAAGNYVAKRLGTKQTLNAPGASEAGDE